ncbi:UNVERIFIED_CONTAM: hypothetical protein Scaly_3091400 [Sesamum calycinum]|uniref:Reverse transcriptase domain-containing protein n=1 Tax=Sesamum calycinum TaxID=2727403 RepID=A0AAW2JNE0_9LAMI
MDASQGYHQIALNPDEQKCVSFITSGRTYCYFGFKNAGVMYQRLVDHMFHDQLGHNMEVYIDDMLVKNRQMDQILVDLAEAFGTLRKFHMKLRPAKCAFGVRSGKFLGYMISRTHSGSQQVHFPIGRAKFVVFLKPYGKTKDFDSDEECQQTFQDLERYLAQLPLLTKPTPGETLYIYLTASQQTVSSVLIKEKEGHQKLIYYVSKVLHGAEQRYP